jgi:colanic acid/amylovoran biosynthesis protein
MKIVIINTHSVLNSGDSGILLAEIIFLREHFSGRNIEITITSRTPQIDIGFYGNMGIDVVSAIFPAPSVTTGFFKKIKYIAGNFLGIKEKTRLLNALKSSDLVLSTGGGYFFSYSRFFPGPMYLQNYLHVKMANILKKPLVFLPQSFGPVNNKIGRILLSEALSHQNVRKIFVRENESVDFLETLRFKNSRQKIKYCQDMAFLLQQPYNNGYEENKISDIRLNPSIAFTLRQWDFPGIKKKQEKSAAQKNYIESLATAAETITGILKGRLIIFPQVRGPGVFENDRIISKDFYKKLEKKLGGECIDYIDFEESLDPIEIIRALKNIDVLVATRFHSAIFGLLALKPVISISYQHKSSGIMKSLGLEKYCIDIKDLNPVKILSLLNEILDDYDEIVLKIKKILSFAKTEINSCLESEI